MRRDPSTEPWVTPTLKRQVKEEKAAKKSSEPEERAVLGAREQNVSVSLVLESLHQLPLRAWNVLLGPDA